MGGLEFYCYEDELWCKTSDGRNVMVDESCTEIVAHIINKVRASYPEAYAALEKWYQKSSANVGYYQFLIAKRFCKCNFAPLDATLSDIDDVDFDGSFHFEKVQCPMRGECPLEGIVCLPKFNSALSPAEYRVMRKFYVGESKEEIAESLFISPETVKNHIKSAYSKLGVHEKAEFVRYAEKNKLFN